MQLDLSTCFSQILEAQIPMKTGDLIKVSFIIHKDREC